MLLISLLLTDLQPQRLKTIHCSEHGDRSSAKSRASNGARSSRVLLPSTP
jgi:hypothetical protein